MIKTSLFAAEERETKLDKLGDILQKLEEHVNFQALAEKLILQPHDLVDFGGVSQYSILWIRIGLAALMVFFLEQ